MRVLIAHASEASRTMLADIVRNGAPGSPDVLATGDGREVLDLLLEDDPPEVALVDWDLPDIEGPEMCRLIRDFHQGHDTWLIVLSSCDRTDTADAWRAGADDCILTPAPAETLLACVAKGLEEMRRQYQKTPKYDAYEIDYEFAEPMPALAAQAEQRPTLEAVCRPDDLNDDGAVGLTADLMASAELKAVADPEDEGDDASHGPAQLAAGPVLLDALRLSESEEPDEPRGNSLLEAVLTRY